MKSLNWGVATALAISIGSSIGAALDDMVVGIGAGIAIACISLVTQNWRRRQVADTEAKDMRQ